MSGFRELPGDCCGDGWGVPLRLHVAGNAAWAVTAVWRWLHTVTARLAAACLLAQRKEWS